MKIYEMQFSKKYLLPRRAYPGAFFIE